MAKPYTKLYTGSGGTPRFALPAITISTGKQKCVAVPFPSSAFITKLVVKQTGGTSKNFDVEVLTSKIPHPVGERNSGTAADDDIELYRALPKQTTTAGNALEVSSPEIGYEFLNVDGSFTENERYLYLLINPATSVDLTTWDVAITARVATS